MHIHMHMYMHMHMHMHAYRTQVHSHEIRMITYNTRTRWLQTKFHDILDDKA